MEPLYLKLYKKKCPHCEVPLTWAKGGVIDSDNTSLSKVSPVRGVFYETGEIQNLILGLEEKISMDLSGLFFTAHKRAITRLFSDLLYGRLGKAARKSAPRILFWQIAVVTPIVGVGSMRIEKYRSGRYLDVRARDIWNETLFGADIAGVWTAVAGKECKVEREADGSDVVYHVEATEEKEEGAERLIPVTGVLMGSQNYPRCPRCGSPESFAIYRWDREKGLIHERDSGLRVVHQTVGCLDAMMQELETKLGRDVRDYAIRTEADFIRSRNTEGTYNGLVILGVRRGSRQPASLARNLGLIKRRCMGNPVSVDYRPGELEVTIRNPANEELVLGRILGTYEAIEEREGRLNWTYRDGLLDVTVSPAG